MRGDTVQVVDALALLPLVVLVWAMREAFRPRRLFCRCGFRLYRSGDCSRSGGCRLS